MGIILSILAEIITYPLPYGKKSANWADYPNLFSGSMITGGMIIFGICYALCKNIDDFENNEHHDHSDYEHDYEIGDYEVPDSTDPFRNFQSESFCSTCYSRAPTDVESSDRSSECMNQKSIYTCIARKHRKMLSKKHKRFRSRARTKNRSERRKTSSTNLNIIMQGTLPGLFKRDFNQDENSNLTVDSDSDTDNSYNNRFIRADSPPHTRSGRIYNDLSSMDIESAL